MPKNRGGAFTPLAYKKRFFGWSKKKREEFIKALSPKALLELRYCTDFWLRDKQIISEGEWRYWLIQAGRGFGKTKAGAGWIKKCVENHQPVNGRHDLYAICGPTHKDITQVMVPAIMAEFAPHERPEYKATVGELVFKNGAIAYCYSSETEIRGPNIQKAWVDELAKWYKPDEQFETLEYAVRIGSPQILITTTPKKHIKTLRKLLAKSLEKPEDIIIVNGSSMENTFLPTSYHQALEDMQGTRKYRQEALGELLDDSEDALWNETVLTDNRVFADPEEAALGRNLPRDITLIRIIVSVDPAGTSNPDSDETGIIVAGVDDKFHAYVLEDASGRYSPDGWAKKTIDLYHKYQANIIVGESNFGGDMVEHTVKTIDPNVPFKKITASRGKLLRAEPIAAKYAQNVVHHVGAAKRFDKLEDQMTSFVGAPSTATKKDDRLDALVWCLTELLISPVYVPRSFINLPNFG